MRSTKILKRYFQGALSLNHSISVWLIVGMFLALGLANPFLAQSVQAQSGVCVAEFQSVGIPLTELGAQEYIRMDGQATGFTGGLYPQGRNAPPAQHLADALRLAQEIVPRAADGTPDEQHGKIGLVSIGMSNTNAEFDTFAKLAQTDSRLNRQVVFINGALGGQTSDKWVDPQALTWQELQNTLARLEVAPEQVQVAWIKETQTRGGEFPAKAQALQADLTAIVQNLQAVFPNLKIAYLSSRIYSYTYERGLSPEPLAYETGFAVKWLVEAQINGDPTLNFDPAQGAVVAPLLLWGPYLWANGSQPRVADDLTWLPEDLTNDCTHPTASGQAKVAAMLLDFFTQDTTARSWFTNLEFEENELYMPVITQTSTSLPTRAPAVTQPVLSTRTPQQVPSAVNLEMSAPEAPVQPQPAQRVIWPVGALIGLAFGGGAAIVWLFSKRGRG